MVFNRNKGFFLTLDDAATPANLELPKKEASQDKQATAKPSVETSKQDAPKPTAAAPSSKTASQPKAVAQTKAVTQAKTVAQAKPDAEAKAVSEAKPGDSSKPSAGMTTAEAIAAELAAADAARPAVTYSTFAPSNLAPGGGLRQRSRRPGAALKSFRGIAQDLFKS